MFFVPLLYSYFVPEPISDIMDILSSVQLKYYLLYGGQCLYNKVKIKENHTILFKAKLIFDIT